MTPASASVDPLAELRRLFGFSGFRPGQREAVPQGGRAAHEIL